ncbi:glycosyltransferase family 4 protein [Enterococcus pseudoavium]|uniref:glycosyltransferase family 4 protein n=1 Tax=Enterococcus pseudoavium TaxID=44007 RepID=UPI00082F44EF|nr:glycosyltransferase family 4 protein [Enterococcus pseudoavium]
MIIIAEHDKQKKKTWSGTTWSLRQALSKKENIKDINISKANRLEQTVWIWKNFLNSNEFIANLNFNSSYLDSVNSMIQYKLMNQVFHNEQILQIGDLATIENSLIYQDLSISYLLNCKKDDPQAYMYSGFKNVSEDSMKRRNEIQLERYSKADRILTMSKSLKQFLIQHEKFPKEKIVHIGGGMNFITCTEGARERVEKQRNKILFVGRDFYRKGGDRVVAAFNLLKNNGLQDLELYIAGPTKIEDKFLSSGVTFLGDLPNEHLSKYFEICDVFCMPSRFEAYGLVFIEALAQGLPCIGLNKFEMPYFIKEGKNGLLVDDPEDIEELAIKIVELLSNEKIFSYVDKQKKKYLKKYSWMAVADRIIEIGERKL